MTYKLSKTSLSLLEECPRCFWLAIIKKIKRPEGIFPSLPNGMDHKIKDHFDRYRDKNELPPELKKHNLDVELFKDTAKLDIWRNNRRGIEYLDKTSGVILYGAVDDMLEKDGKLIVIDFKTRGFDLKEDTHHVYQDQLNIYTFLLQKNGYKTEDYAYLLFYIPEKVLETGEFVFKTELVKMNVNVEHAERLFQKAVKVLNEEMPESGEDCGYCKWKNGKD